MRLPKCLSQTRQSFHRQRRQMRMARLPKTLPYHKYFANRSGTVAKMQTRNWHVAKCDWYRFGGQNAPNRTAFQQTSFGEVNLFQKFGVFIGRDGEKDRFRCQRALSRVLVHLNMRCGGVAGVTGNRIWLLATGIYEVQN